MVYNRTVGSFQSQNNANLLIPIVPHQSLFSFENNEKLIANSRTLQRNHSQSDGLQIQGNFISTQESLQHQLKKKKKGRPLLHQKQQLQNLKNQGNQQNVSQKYLNQNQKSQSQANLLNKQLTLKQQIYKARKQSIFQFDQNDNRKLIHETLQHQQKLYYQQLDLEEMNKKSHLDIDPNTGCFVQKQIYKQKKPNLFGLKILNSKLQLVEKMLELNSSRDSLENIKGGSHTTQQNFNRKIIVKDQLDGGWSQQLYVNQNPTININVNDTEEINNYTLQNTLKINPTINSTISLEQPNHYLVNSPSQQYFENQKYFQSLIDQQPDQNRKNYCLRRTLAQDSLKQYSHQKSEVSPQIFDLQIAQKLLKNQRKQLQSQQNPLQSSQSQQSLQSQSQTQHFSANQNINLMLSDIHQSEFHSMAEKQKKVFTPTQYMGQRRRNQQSRLSQFQVQPKSELQNQDIMKISINESPDRNSQKGIGYQDQNQPQIDYTAEQAGQTLTYYQVNQQIYSPKQQSSNPFFGQTSSILYKKLPQKTSKYLAQLSLTQSHSNMQTYMKNNKKLQHQQFNSTQQNLRNNNLMGRSTIDVPNDFNQKSSQMYLYQTGNIQSMKQLPRLSDKNNIMNEIANMKLRRNPYQSILMDNNSKIATVPRQNLI
eukprot:403336262